jgi:hypothetical protein
MTLSSPMTLSLVMHPELVEGRTFWSGSGPARRRVLAGLDFGRNQGRNSQNRPRAEGWLGNLSVKSERLLRLGGDSEKKSTISASWGKLPS